MIQHLDPKALIAGSVILVSAIIGYVVLATTNTSLEGARGIFLFVIPLVQLIFGAAQLKPIEQKADDLKQQASNIAKSTNGVLDARVEEIAEAVSTATVEKATAMQSSEQSKQQMVEFADLFAKKVAEYERKGIEDER